jgi:hypothetical protein
VHPNAPESNILHRLYEEFIAPPGQCNDEEELNIPEAKLPTLLLILPETSSPEFAVNPGPL